MDLKKKFDFINGKLETLMLYRAISSRDYVKISKQLILAEDDIDFSNVMIEMEAAVIKEQTRKDKEKIEQDEAKRKKEEEREARRRAK